MVTMILLAMWIGGMISFVLTGWLEYERTGFPAQFDYIPTHRLVIVGIIMTICWPVTYAAIVYKGRKDKEEWNRIEATRVCHDDTDES